MATRAESSTSQTRDRNRTDPGGSGRSVLDGVKWLLVVVIMAAAMTGFYYLSGHSLLYRVLGLLAVSGVCVAIALRTEQGLRAWEMAQEARNEVRKVVWPTRKETMQTTTIVIAMVFVVALILWGFDGLLGFLVRQLFRIDG